MFVLLGQHTDVLEQIIDLVDGREDLLALALTCARLCDIIVPSHLSYRRVVISLSFEPFFNLVKSRPDLAERVRELTIINTSPNVRVPRVHAFRRDFPESRLLFASGYDDEFLFGGSSDTKARRPFDISNSLDDALFCLPRLRRLQFRGVFETVPLQHILSYHRDNLESLSLDRTHLHGTAPENLSTSLLTSSIWKMSNLSILELGQGIGDLSCSDWDPFCSVLERSPLLEVLSIPVFSYTIDDTLVTVPQLMHLQRVSTYGLLYGDDTIRQRIFNFLDNHPSIEEMDWRTKSAARARAPRLPMLKRMLGMNHARILSCIPSSDLAYSRILGRHLDTVTFEVKSLGESEYRSWDWKVLGLVFPTSLRSLHVDALDFALETYEMLDALSLSFPRLEELVLPDDGSRYKAMEGDVTAMLVPDLGRGPEGLSVIKRPHLREIIKRFPNLSSVAGVDVGLDDHTKRARAFYASSTGVIPTYLDMHYFFKLVRDLSTLHDQYPRLCTADGWQLNVDHATAEVIMSVDVRQKLRRDNTAAQVVLTRESICVRYPGSHKDSQPVEIGLKQPYPIPRTYYL